jgi:hypothetical protein
MVFTNPNAISNSANAKSYTNIRSKIHMLNLNLIDNGNIYNNFLNSQFNEQFTSPNSNNTNNVSNDNDFIKILQNQKLQAKFAKLYQD